ncbi:MAG: hypothetical protein HYX61_08725 [Gammaproteobacteria bacterium]|jgi:hypothetical protein|nr:hypothetical protein [Gammaproteobacteria bacterium]
MTADFNYLAARSYGLEDYKKMFGLTASELDMKIVNCYAGASIFAKEMTEHRLRVVACDPLYAKPIHEIKQTIEKAQLKLIEEINNHPERFVLKGRDKDIINKENVGLLIEDLSKGTKEGRYTQDALPKFTFQDEQFDLALVNHYIFSNNDHRSAEFHVKAIEEFIRIAPEVRLFPLVTKESHLSPHVGEVAALLQVKGYGVEIRGVSFAFQTHGNAMMRIWSSACDVIKHQQSQ